MSGGNWEGSWEAEFREEEQVEVSLECAEIFEGEGCRRKREEKGAEKGGVEASPQLHEAVFCIGGEGDPIVDFCGENGVLLPCVAVHGEPDSEGFLGLMRFHLGDREVESVRVWK